MRRFQKPSVPIIIRPPYQDTPLYPGDEFTVDITLVGTAIPHAGAIVEAMATCASNASLCQGMHASLMSVSTIGHQGDVTMVTDDAIRRRLIPLSLLSLDVTAGGSTSAGLDVEFIFETPLRLLDAGKTARAFSFGLFFRALMRRLSALSYYYCDYELPLDFRRFSEEAGRARVSSSSLCFCESEGRKGQGGLMGNVRVQIPHEDFVPLLITGSYFNVGKGASAGFGQFRVVPPANP